MINKPTYQTELDNTSTVYWKAPLDVNPRKIDQTRVRKPPAVLLLLPHHQTHPEKKNNKKIKNKRPADA